MLVLYGDEPLRQLIAGDGPWSDGWDVALIRSYRRRHQSLVAARDRGDLQALRSLDLRTEKGRDGVDASIQLVNGARLLLGFDVMNTDVVRVMGVVGFDRQKVTS